MANETAKKNHRSNVKRLQVFTWITCVINCICFLIMLYRGRSLPSLTQWMGVVFWAGQEFFALRLLRESAKPVLSPAGVLVDCRDISDPKQLGYLSFAQDVLWVCWVVQPLSVVVHWAFVVFYLPVPATIAYQAWTMVIAPLIQARHAGTGGHVMPPGQGDPAASGPVPRNRAERRKLERKSRR